VHQDREPQRLPTRQRREQILDRALTLYSASGYGPVGMRDLATACDMTATSIYRHFDSKEAVLIGIFDRLSDEMTSTMREASRINVPRERLAFLIRAHIRLALSDPPILRVYQREELSLPPNERERFRKVELSYITQWSDTLRTLCPETSSSEARTAAIAAFGAINALSATRSVRTGRRVAAQLTTITYRVLGIGPDV
jgi:AcrR family transcriptional regulator